MERFRTWAGVHKGSPTSESSESSETPVIEGREGVESLGTHRCPPSPGHFPPYIHSLGETRV